MSNALPELPIAQNAAPKTGVGRWLRGGGGGHGAHHPMWPWWKVIWLTGVDYFSSLGYQPGIALVAVGAIAPAATFFLVLVTLFGALPIYSEVAKRSSAGQGSIAMLEKLVPGWTGKAFVLALIGFAATDFVITMTLSAADAAEHAIHNPYLEPYLGDAQLGVTVVLLVLLAIVFLRGFSEAIGIATAIAIPYLLLNVIVLVRGAWEIVGHPALLADWRAELPTDWTALIIAAGLGFPKLALGLSGFETGVSVMPLVDGKDAPGAPPMGRIQGTKHLLVGAALIMSVLLLASSVVAACLIPESAYHEGGAASGRALAWLAHTYLGDGFGSVYDLATILILWFAGASASAALLSLIPRYLPRFGMAPHWVSHSRPLVLLILAINIAVTVAFDADVEAQGGAYATGVLALILSGAVAVTLSNRAEGKFGKAAFFGLVSLVFAYTFVDNVVERHDGIIISSIFIAAVLILGGLSRYLRATELRVQRLHLADEESASLWPELRGKKVHIVSVREATEDVSRKRAELRRHYNVRGHLAWVHIELADDRSQFDTECEVQVRRSGPDYLITVTNAVAVANTLAYVSEQLDPISLFLGLTRGNPVTQALQYLLWGEGETGILVYQILVRYWGWTPEDDERPRIFLMSD